MDHIFIGGGLEWNIFVRVVPNQSGSTTSWIFMRPNGLDDDNKNNDYNDIKKVSC